MKTRAPFLIFLVFLITLTLWRLWPALFLPNMAVGTMGDAAGTIGWIWEVGRQFDVHSWAVFLNGDLLKTTFFGAGLMDPVPVMNPAWRLLYVGVTRFDLTPDNAYDLVIAIQYVVAGIVGWFFAASFGLHAVWRFVFVFLMLSIENTSIRIAGHNGLVFIYGPMLALMGALKYAQKPSRTRALLFSFTLWLSFLSNEYFGYFSIWGCLTLIVAHDWLLFRNSFKSHCTYHLKALWPAAVAGLALLCLSHPSVTIYKVVDLWERLFESSNSAANFQSPGLRESNPSSEFLLYGLKNPLAVLDSWLIPLPDELAPKVFGRNTHEFTFRWGLVLPLFIWWVLRLERTESSTLPYKRILFSIVIVTFFLGMRTDVGLSLGWLTRIFAPMFRVGVRAQFISLVLMILLLTLSAQWLWEHRKNHWGSKRLLAIYFTVFGLSTIELARSGPIFGQHKVFPVSQLSFVALQLRGEPNGLTLLSPALDGHWESESYYLASLHSKPVLNSQFGHRDGELRKVLFSAVDSPSESAKRQLEACGIRYLIDAKSGRSPFGWSSVSGLRLVATSAAGQIFELPKAQNWPITLGPARHSDVTSTLVRGRSFLSECLEIRKPISSDGAKHP